MLRVFCSFEHYNMVKVNPENFENGVEEMSLMQRSLLREFGEGRGIFKMKEKELQFRNV